MIGINPYSTHIQFSKYTMLSLQLEKLYAIGYNPVLLLEKETKKQNINTTEHYGGTGGVNKHFGGAAGAGEHYREPR